MFDSFLLNNNRNKFGTFTQYNYSKIDEKKKERNINKQNVLK